MNNRKMNVDMFPDPALIGRLFKVTTDSESLLSSGCAFIWKTIDLHDDSARKSLLKNDVFTYIGLCDQFSRYFPYFVQILFETKTGFVHRDLIIYYCKMV